MEIKIGENDLSGYGPGVVVLMTEDEVALAVTSWLVTHNVYIFGPRTVRVGGAWCGAEVFVDPEGSAIADGKRYSGRGKIET